MSTKRYNTKTFDFVVNGEHVYFVCDTTNTKKRLLPSCFCKWRRQILRTFPRVLFKPYMGKFPV